MPAESSASDEDTASRHPGAYGDYLAEREEILRHKWVLSERAGFDAGFEAALMDWAYHHRTTWRRQRTKKGAE